MDPIVDNPECMEAYSHIIECLYSSPSQETSTIFKLLSCLPAISIDIEERSDFLQDLYNEVKQKMMNMDMSKNTSGGVNWNQVVMNLQTIMHVLESNQGMNEGMNEMWDDRDEYANWNDIRNEYGYEPPIQYDEEGYPIKYDPQDLEEQDPSTISSFTKKMWEIERKRRMNV